MSGDFLDDRRRGLEEAFFAKHNEALRQKLGQASGGGVGKESLSAASGITDPDVLDKLGTLGVGAETLAALSMVPLVLVAWADGSIDDKERAAILSAAAQSGIPQTGATHDLLDAWLRQRPSDELFAAWKAYASGMIGRLDASAGQALRKQLLGRARNVAEATGGLLGFGSKVSAAEDAVLRQLETALA